MKTPGYGTIAKSEGLDDKLISETLNELCFYESPAELAGEEDISKYPKALFCVNTEDNKMVIGRSAFAGRDYTGERNRYFTHLYVVPKEEREKYIENPEKIVYASGFATAYDISNGERIDEISEIESCYEEDRYDSIEELYLAAAMDKDIFKNLLKACFDSCLRRKKIYIVLEANDIDIVAKGIMKYLYRGLPFEIRRSLGFITYIKEPKIKDFINIEFLCKGSIKRLTTEIKAGYIFDLPNKEFYIQGIEEQHAFIDFAADNIENKEILNRFFYSADKLSKSRNSISAYDEILVPSKKQEHLQKKEDKAPTKKDEEIDNHWNLRLLYKKILSFFK